jgi:hypothetical protein
MNTFNSKSITYVADNRWTEYALMFEEIYNIFD